MVGIGMIGRWAGSVGSSIDPCKCEPTNPPTLFLNQTTGFDNAAFRTLAKTATAEAGKRMQAIPELMYFLDKDPTVSAFFRNRAF